MPAEVIKWCGGPGSGKTTTLIGFIQNEIQAGTRFGGDISVMSFSRAQAADLSSRLMSITDLDEAIVKKQVATIDATTYRLCRDYQLMGNGRDHILQPGDKKRDGVFAEFMQPNHLDYDPRRWIVDAEDAFSEIPYGNQFIALNAVLTATMQPPTNWREFTSSLGLSIPGDAFDIPDLISAWAEFKTERDLFEHGDYIRLALTEQVPPPAPIIVVDEYQDVSPAQDALIRHWINHPDTKRVYIAGDPDQSIYGFRGCDPNLFTTIAASNTELKKPVSHRCGVNIMGAAERILNKPANVLPNESSPGRVIHIRCHSADDLTSHIEQVIGYARKYDKFPIYILSRYRHFTQIIGRSLARAGIPCQGIKPTTNNRLWNEASIGKTKFNLYDLKNTVRKYLFSSASEEITLNEILDLLMVVSTVKPSDHSNRITEYLSISKSRALRVSDLHELTGGRRDTILELLTLNQYHLDQIRRCLIREDRRGFVVSPDQIAIDTIHAAKGLEAPIVLLHTGYLKTHLRGLGIPARLAEERRIYFVGATRASHHLTILDYGNGPTCPVTEGVWLQ